MSDQVVIGENEAEPSVLTREEVEFVHARIVDAFQAQMVFRGLRENHNGIRLSGNDWPNNAIMEINEGRATLQSRGYVNSEPVLIAPRSMLELLDREVSNTNVTYRQFLIQNALVSEIREADDEQQNIILVSSGENMRLRGAKPRFSDEVVEKAWKLLEEYMAPAQYFAFMEGSKIELKNKTGKFRLLIDKNGDFNILEGKTGEGIMASSGRIKSYNYPLGDEVATFIDWFNFKTEELIAQWNCGTYGIVKEGQRR